MKQQQMQPTMVSGGHQAGFSLIMVISALVSTLAIVLIWRLIAPAPILPAAQPVVGQHMVVTGMVFDGTRYINAPIAVGVERVQPAIGQHTTITGPVFDGTRYVNVPIAVGAERIQPTIGEHMVVTGPVFDGTRYVNKPIVIGSR